MSANFSAFEVRSPVFEPSTPRREGRVPKLNSSWFMDPNSPTSMSAASPNSSSVRTSTPTRGSTARQVAPFSPIYRSSAVFGTGSRVATPVRRVGTPRTGTPTTPYARTNSGTPTAAYQRVVSGTPTSYQRQSSGTPSSYQRQSSGTPTAYQRQTSGTPTTFQRQSSGTPNQRVVSGTPSGGSVYRSVNRTSTPTSVSRGIVVGTPTRAGTPRTSTPTRVQTPRTRPEVLFGDIDRRPATPRTPQRAATPVQARSSRPQTPLDSSTNATSFVSNGITASETSFVSTSSYRKATNSPREVKRTIGRPEGSQAYTTSQEQQPQFTRMATPTRHLSSAPNYTSGSLLSAFVDHWNNRYSENKNNYREGGYMNVQPSDLLKQRYVMLQKLGWGEFSTVWLAYDKMAENPRNLFVAIKIAKCSNSVTDSTRYEIALLKFLRESLNDKTPITHLLDHFEHTGAYGTHQCFVMAVHGSNMLCVIDQMKARRRRRSEKELTLIKEITSSTLESLDQLQSVNVIHTDLKPENVLCSAPDPKVVKIIEGFLNRNQKFNRSILDSFANSSRAPVVLADFGLSVLLEPSSVASKVNVGSKKEFKVHVPGVVSNQTGTLIQTREYRAPEILFGADFNSRSDIWSLGCMVYELITGNFLVDPKKKTKDEREMDIEHLAMIMQIIGPVPHRIACSSRGTGAPRYIHRYFNEHGQFIYAEKYKRYPRRSLAAELEVFLEPSEAERAAQFIMSCFTYDPMERCNASDLLKHSWLKTA